MLYCMRVWCEASQIIALGHLKSSYLCFPFFRFFDEDDSKRDVSMIRRIKGIIIQGLRPFFECREWICETQRRRGLAMRFDY